MSDRLHELLDKHDISEALLRYCRGIDRIDAALIESAYHPDATDDHGLFKGKATEFVPWVVSVLPNLEVTQHKISNIQIELHGDIAYVESYYMAIHAPKAHPVEEFTFGRYVDRFERRVVGWRIADRKVVLDFTTVRPRGEPYRFEDKFLRFSRDKSDPVYARL